MAIEYETNWDAKWCDILNKEVPPLLKDVRFEQWESQLDVKGADTGLPVELPISSHRALSSGRLQTEPLRVFDEGTLTAPFEVTIPIPNNIHGGVYGVWLGNFSAGYELKTLGGPRLIQHFLQDGNRNHF